MEEMIINSTIQIPAGNQTCWHSKNIQLDKDSSIVCNGTLVLEDCIIHSRKSRYTGQFKVNSKGQLKVLNCTFINYGKSEKYVIRLEKGCSAEFKGCTFENCNHHIGFIGNLTMQDCQFINCTFSTLSTLYICDNAICNLENITINNDAYTPVAKKVIENPDYSLRTCFHIESKKCRISNIHISESPEFSQNVLKYAKKHYCESLCIFTRGTIENITMETTTMPVCSQRLIQNGKFTNCVTPVQTRAEVFNNRPAVKNCEFINCTNVICADHRSKIENCTFSDCYGNLIRQKKFSSDGGISVESCRFLKCTNAAKEYKHIMFRYIIPDTATLLFFSGSKTSRPSIVRNCLIEGMVLDEGYFIATDTLYKTPDYIVKVSNCTFADCYTNRNDYEIFKRSVQYYGAFGRDKNDPAIQVQKCIGLNEIRNDFVDDFDEQAFDEDDFEDDTTAEATEQDVAEISSETKEPLKPEEEILKNTLNFLFCKGN